MSVEIITGDALEISGQLEDGAVNCVVTSPPYWGLRDYGIGGQIGLENTPDKYVSRIVEIFRGIWPVLRDDGTLWLNLGDSYTSNSKPGGGDPRIGRRNIGQSSYTSTIVPGIKPKNLVGIPWRVAFALQADGWYLRSDIIWAKSNCMPESVTDRPTKSHEYVFLMSKSKKYYYDIDSIREPFDRPECKFNPDVSGHKTAALAKQNNNTTAGLHDGRTQYGDPEKGRNRRTVWTIPTQPNKESHFAIMPPELVRPCVLAGCPIGGTVLDPFAGTGTTGLVAEQEGRNSILIELNPEYAEIAKRRTSQRGLFCSAGNPGDNGS